MTPWTPIYRRRFCHLYHPRIVHLCYVLEVAPSKSLISKVLISLFFYFWSWFHNIDQHHSERIFDVGDWVILQLQSYKQMSLKQAKKDNKLSPKHYGPYKALQKIGTMAYTLELPVYSRVH